jgi:hypothetical protein
MSKGISPVDLDELDDDGNHVHFSGEVEGESDESDGGIEGNEGGSGSRRGKDKAGGRGKGARRGKGRGRGKGKGKGTGKGKGKGKAPSEEPKEPTGESPPHPATIDADVAPVWLRTANYIAFVETGTTKMVELTPARAAQGCDLLGWMAPLSGGTRRATRAWLGYTPPWSQHTDQDVWYMDVRYGRVHINSMPEWTSEVVMRHR